MIAFVMYATSGQQAILVNWDGSWKFISVSGGGVVKDE